MRLLGVAAILAGCGRIGFDPHGADDASVTIDANDPNGCPPGLAPGSLASALGSLPAWGATRTTSAAITLSFASSELVVDLAANVASEQYAVLDSTARYDARRRILRTRVLEIPSPVLGAEALLAWYSDDDNKATLGLVNGRLTARTVVGGLDSETGEAFPAILEPWWQLVSDGTTLAFEVSADGIAWRRLHTTPVPAYFTTVKPTLAAGTTRAVASPGRARFDLLLDCQ